MQFHFPSQLSNKKEPGKHISLDRITERDLSCHCRDSGGLKGETNGTREAKTLNVIQIVSLQLYHLLARENGMGTQEQRSRSLYIFPVRDCRLVYSKCQFCCMDQPVWCVFVVLCDA